MNTMLSSVLLESISIRFGKIERNNQLNAFDFYLFFYFSQPATFSFSLHVYVCVSLSILCKSMPYSNTVANVHYVSNFIFTSYLRSKSHRMANKVSCSLHASRLHGSFAFHISFHTLHIHTLTHTQNGECVCVVAICARITFIPVSVVVRRSHFRFSNFLIPSDAFVCIRFMYAEGFATFSHFSPFAPVYCVSIFILTTIFYVYTR